MIYRIHIFVVKLAILYFTFGTGAPETNTQLRIINGSTAGVGEFKFMCAVYYSGYFTCGGTILSEEWVLTAAHCVYKRDESKFSVLTGTNDLLDSNGTETAVSYIIVHELYNNSINQANDLALLKLTVALDFDSMTQPVILSHPKVDPPENSTVVVMGWGVNEYMGNPMRLLQKAILMSCNNSECARIYKPYYINILNTNICAGTPEGGIGQCTGDSGGPVVLGDSPNIQVGIISFSAKPCGIKGFPGVSTRVSEYIEWIKFMTGL